MLTRIVLLLGTIYQTILNCTLQVYLPSNEHILSQKKFKKKLAAVRLLLVALYTFCTQNDKPHRFPSRKSLLPSCGEYISQPLATKPMYEGCDLTNILAFLRQLAFPDWTEWKNKDPTILAWPGPHLTPLFPPTIYTLLHLFPDGVGHHPDNCDASSIQFLLLPFSDVDLWHISFTLNSISLSTSREINLW